MAVTLYMDHHVPKSITDALRMRTVDVITAFEDDRRQVPDSEILTRATELRRVLFTRDKDFLAITRDLLHQQITFCGLVYAHQLHVSLGKCIEDLELIAKTNEPEDVITTVYFLPL